MKGEEATAMPVGFGTSGLRGPVKGLTTKVVSRYLRAFVAACDTGGVVCVGHDLRPSSPRIAGAVIDAACEAGVRVIDCGALPTPALALAARAHGGGAVMVTGSHIPADRNGLKFYSVDGEITKADEVAIAAALDKPTKAPGRPPALPECDCRAGARFVARYVDAFGANALAGKRVGVYGHSAVGRDLLVEILRALGAQVTPLGWSNHFIPIDTEAIDQSVRDQIKAWVRGQRLDALVSTDGDSDRPLLADENGCVVPGDLLGQIAAEVIAAEVVVTPITSNSGLENKNFLATVRTKIGSPYVIEAMGASGGAVAGYEANGGFLLGFDAAAPAGRLAALPTRDSVLPLLAVLWAAGNGPVSQRIKAEPQAVTRADRLRGCAPARAKALVARLASNSEAREAFLARLAAAPAGLDLTDGVRMMLQGGGIVQVRPSGNAPELRIYIEAQDAARADVLLRAGVAALRQAMDAGDGAN